MSNLPTAFTRRDVLRGALVGLAAVSTTTGVAIALDTPALALAAPLDVLQVRGSDLMLLKIAPPPWAEDGAPWRWGADEVEVLRREPRMHGRLVGDGEGNWWHFYDRPDVQAQARADAIVAAFDISADPGVLEPPVNPRTESGGSD